MAATTTTTSTNAASKSTRYSWESGPMKLITTPVSQTGAKDQFTWMASEMALVHNIISRALNSIYLQARHVPVSEHANFVRYALSISQCLHAHHHGEETHLFPDIERIAGEKGLMESNVAGHREFEDNLHAWGEWLESLAKDPKNATFDGEKCVAMMDAFIPALSAHLADEIPTLLNLERFGDKLDLRTLGANEGRNVMGSLHKTNQLPVLFHNHDFDFEGGIHTDFPPLPSPAQWFVRVVLGWWQREWWKFGTCGRDGKVKELLYLGEAK